MTFNKYIHLGTTKTFFFYLNLFLSTILKWAYEKAKILFGYFQNRFWCKSMKLYFSFVISMNVYAKLFCTTKRKCLPKSALMSVPLASMTNIRNKSSAFWTMEKITHTKHIMDTNKSLVLNSASSNSKMNIFLIDKAILGGMVEKGPSNVA